MDWRTISDPPAKVTDGLLLWDGEHWWEGRYTKSYGFGAYEEGIEGPFTQYLIVLPPE